MTDAHGAPEASLCQALSIEIELGRRWESGREALRQRRVACLGAPVLGEVVEDPADDRWIEE